MSIKNKLKLTSDQLAAKCDPSLFSFISTAEISPLEGIIGQERAVKAMTFGLHMNNTGYNIYMSGPPGTGKNSYAKAILAHTAKEGKIPADWCYIYNFQQPEKPRALSLPAGKGKIFVRDMERLIKNCRHDIKQSLTSEEFEQQRGSLMEQLQRDSGNIFRELEEDVLKLEFALRRSGQGIATIPLKNGKPLEQSQFAELGPAEKANIEENSRKVQKKLEESMRRIHQLETGIRARITELEKDIAFSVLKPGIDAIKANYKKFPKIIAYLDETQADIIEHLSNFKAEEDRDKPLALFTPKEGDESFFVRYRVNLFVDNNDSQTAPIIFEANPTYYNLFGKIEGRATMGGVTTDFTMIKSGAIHRANGGYLVIQAADLLKDAWAWDALKRTLANAEAQVENIGESYRTVPITTLKPEPIPVRIKIILIGSPAIHQTLYSYDENFRELFKIRADFASAMPRNNDTIKKYAAFICNLCERDGLAHFTPDAVAGVVDFSSRLADDRIKLSTRFNDIVELLYEANTWAQLENAAEVEAEHVKRAIAEKIYRSNQIEERLNEMTQRGALLLDTEGEVVGQINGLSVYSTGDYNFGRPTRITAQAYVGKAGVINIEREAKLSGKIHDKGVLILSGFLGNKYAKDKPLALTASLAFEQSYAGVDGDSASCAELIALLSAIAGVPIRQNLAITGSINQRGQIQPIGGVNQKIEGFFKICSAQGLNGEQGVLIPIQNIDNLMLDHNIIEAVEEGSFQIYAISTVDEAIELMTDLPAHAVHKKVAHILESMGKKIQWNLSPTDVGSNFS